VYSDTAERTLGIRGKHYCRNVESWGASAHSAGLSLQLFATATVLRLQGCFTQQSKGIAKMKSNEEQIGFSISKEKQLPLGNYKKKAIKD
jgi:hypothetical protein